jgi:predicted nucleic acid-binding protein
VTPAELVVDASVVVRGLRRENDEAVAFLVDVGSGASTAHAPDLLVPEVTHALSRYAIGDRRDLEAALASLEALAAAPIRLHATIALAPLALEVAALGELSSYDAFHAVLADVLDVPLATADRSLAAAVPDSILVS